LNAEIPLPKNATGPVPFMIVLHGCTGLGTLEWAHRVADRLNPEGVGVLVLAGGVLKSKGLSSSQVVAINIADGVLTLFAKTA
jgi:dienelactone hydrolase